MDTASSLPWYRQIPARIRVLLPLKAVGTMVFMLLFFWGYFAVLRYPLATATIMPLTPVDVWIPMTPAAFPAYVSLWVYVSLPPAFLTGLRTLLRYGFWIAALCLFCLGIFWIWPTAVPAVPVDWTQHPEMALIKGMDAGGNACPSLHVASAVFAGLWLDRLARAMRLPVLLRWVSALHCCLILWSTLATRQHVFLDVLAGLAVGGLFAALALWHVGKVARPGEI